MWCHGDFFLRKKVVQNFNLLSKWVGVMVKYIELLSHINDVIVYFKMKFKLTQSSENWPQKHDQYLISTKENLFTIENVTLWKEKNLNTGVCCLHIFILDTGGHLSWKKNHVYKFHTFLICCITLPTNLKNWAFKKREGGGVTDPVMRNYIMDKYKCCWNIVICQINLDLVYFNNT